MGNPRVDLSGIRVSPELNMQLRRAMRKAGITSRNEAVNKAIEFWARAILNPPSE